MIFPFMLKALSTPKNNQSLKKNSDYWKKRPPYKHYSHQIRLTFGNNILHIEKHIE